MIQNKYKILIVEDEKNISRLIKMNLDAGGYQAIEASTCTNAITIFQTHNPDLVILDLGLPDMDGSRFIKEARHTSSVPIIVLSARTEESEKVHALDLGANDYVTKPFSSAELLARVRSNIRTHNLVAENISPMDPFHSGELEIKYESRQVFFNEEEIHFTQTEYNILALLSRNCGKMMSYQTIIDTIWGVKDNSSTKKLQVNMANIRRKFGISPGQNWFIRNELGVGYRLDDTNRI
ncbi:MAG: response regulator transcription factor [Clostridiales bacterium]|jgi:two-component system KDP operon response regulator KdpE|nr:response regulator transcription factor [Clostridiales bacterium]